MKYLYVFVEGLDDERFVNWYLKRLNINYKIVLYANERKDKINKFLVSIKNTEMMDYLFLGDIDFMEHTKKIDAIVKVYPKCSKDKIILVKKEIESWYLAGLDEENCRKMNIKYYINTNDITKEQFNSIKPKKYTRIDFMIEILKKFNVSCAINRNDSLKEFSKVI